VSPRSTTATLELSLVITTYGGETAHTQACLGRIRRWKRPEHEVIVVVHDESPTLRVFLELCRRLGIVDRLVLAESDHGHVRSVNLGFALSRAELVFNACIDMRIGGRLVADCAEILRTKPSAGMIGWHYDWSPDCEGSFWRDGKLITSIRHPDATTPGGRLLEEQLINIRGAAWQTGRTLDSVGDLRFTCCNGSFFGIRRSVWDRLGGFDESLYPIHFADDFLTYAVLDQGLDVLNVPSRYRCGRDPDELLALTDLAWQGRNDPLKSVDRVDWRAANSASDLGDLERGFLEMLDRALAKDASLLVVGDPPWRPTAQSEAGGLADLADLVVCAPGHYRAGLESRLHPGGLLISFNAEEGPRNAALVGSLLVFRAPERRVRYERAALARG
jgi:GT2 family glycosyltransferase